MEEKKPGIWIVIAVLLAVIVVAVSVPKNRLPAPTPEAAPTAISEAAPAPPSAASTDGVPAKTPSRPVGVPMPDTAPVRATAPVAGTQPPPSPGLVPPGSLPPPEHPVSREEARQALDNVHFAIRDFRSALGENPVGTNAEITKALMGSNL